MTYDGILPLFKPKGMTSHDCVFKIRKLLKMKKVGHTGTLDPDVTGVLPICLGRATKIAEYMSDYPKEYIGEVTIGWSTTTEDRGGDLIEKKSVEQPFGRGMIEEVLQECTGEMVQIPPMYSAVKVKGKKLYEYAREGIEVERPKRTIFIHQLQLMSDIDYDPAEKSASFRFQVRCSKGTYIRTLAVDIGEKLGYPAHLSFLQRTASGPFRLKDCITMEDLERIIKENKLELYLKPLEAGIAHFKHITVDDDTARKIKHGSVLPMPKTIEETKFSVYNKQGDCLAIYQRHPSKVGLMKPEKMFINE